MSFRRNSYSAALAMLLLGILLTGAYALSLLIQGEPAYPVRMIGQAQLSAQLVGAYHIRPPASTPPAVGTLPHLLTLPPAPVYGDGSWAANDLARRDLRGSEARQLDQARKLNEMKEWDRSLKVYDALVAAHPSAIDLALERAHVLAWAGRSDLAGPALLKIARERRDAALAFEAAQNIWWGGNPVAADAALALVLELNPKFAGVAELRRQVRASATPSLAVAREWARNGGQLEQLMYARALVEAKDYSSSFDPYRRAIALGAPDSIRLELAAAANAADSAHVAEQALIGYLALHENADDIRLTLARQYAWSERYTDAVHEYDVLIANGNRVAVAPMERAQTIVWSGALPAGAAALREVVREESTQIEAWRLLGDVERWLAHPKEALVAYQTAARLQPGDPQIGMQIAAVQEDLRLLRRAGMPVTAARVRIEGLNDNSGFSYVQTRADQFMATEWGGFQLSALNTMPSRNSSPVSRSSASGYGGAASVTFRPRPGLQLDGGGSIESYGDIGTFLGYTAGVTYQVVEGTTVHAGYVREPAVRRAGTLLALQARAVSERIELLATGRLGTWGWSAQAEQERMSSDLGAGNRSSAALAASYALSKSLTFDTRVSALRTGTASPTLPGFGALYWSPEYYVEPSAGLSWRGTAARGLTVGGGVTGGYAFAKERPGLTAGTLLGNAGVPTFALRGEAAYQRGRWGVMLDVGYGGALGRGYRSVNSALGVSYTLPR